MSLSTANTINDMRVVLNQVLLNSTPPIGTLSDVDVTGISDGDILVWDTADGTFKAGTLSLANGATGRVQISGTAGAFASSANLTFISNVLSVPGLAANTANVESFTANTANVGSLTANTANVVSLEAGDIIESSSKRYKKNIKSIENSLDMILKLNPVSFKWKYDDKFDYGLIAEDVITVIPEMAKNNVDGLVDGVRYSKLVTFLIGSIKTLNDRIIQLEKNEKV